LVILEFELRGSCLLGRCFTTWATLPASLFQDFDYYLLLIIRSVNQWISKSSRWFWYGGSLSCILKTLKLYHMLSSSCI
jgi:hypothetical protein